MAKRNFPVVVNKDCENALNYVLKYNDLVFGAYDTGLMGLCYKIAKENNKTIVMVTHDPRMTRYASRVIEIHDGKLVSIKTGEEIK